MDSNYHHRSVIHAEKSLRNNIKLLKTIQINTIKFQLKNMKPEIDFQSTNRFYMSSGLVLFIASVVLATQLIPLNSVFSNIFAIAIMFPGLLLIYYGHQKMKDMEKFEKQIKREQMVNQIIDQDLKLINLQIKVIEHNEKVNYVLKNNTSTLEYKETRHRGIENIAKQALNPNFYEETYPTATNKKKNE